MKRGTTSGGGAEATVAAHEIARLADVGRAAVSNWRRRFPDFPQPVGGTSASPLYSLAAVEAWLTKHGKSFRLQPGDRVWQRIRGAVDDLRLSDLVSHLGALLAFQRRDAAGWKAFAGAPAAVVAAELPAAIAAALPQLPGEDAAPLDLSWVEIGRMAVEAAEAVGHERLLEFLCDRYVEVHSRRVPVTPEHVGELMVQLAQVEGVVLDPACGIGTLLLTAHRRGAAQLRGQELQPAMARLAAARLLLHDTVVRVAAGDSLRTDAFEQEHADAVICAPPFGDRDWGHEELAGDPRWAYGLPPKSEPELAWAQHCLAHVRPGGRVVIMMPAGAASRRPGRRIRRNLLRSGALRAVIRLPGQVSALVGASDLWLMQRPSGPDSAPSHVLMVDVSAASAADTPVIAKAWRQFLADAAGAELPEVARAVRILDLLDEDIDISPPRYVRRAASEAQSQRYGSVRERLLTAAGALDPGPPVLTLTQAGTQPAATVEELVRAGLIGIRQAPLKTPLDGGDTPLLTVKDVRRGRPASGTTVVGPGSVALQPGDVIVPLASAKPVVRVAEQCGAILGPHLLLFRPDPQRIDPYFLAGFLRAAQIASTTGSQLTRSDLRRTMVPRLPIAEQRRYGEVFRDLFSYEDRLQTLATVGDDLVRLGFMGLADGSLRPTGD